MCQVGLRRGLVDILADSTAEFVSSLVDAGSLPITVKPCNGVTHTGAPTSWALAKLSSVEISGMLLHPSQSDVIWQLCSIDVPSLYSFPVALQQFDFFPRIPCSEMHLLLDSCATIHHKPDNYTAFLVRTRLVC